MCPPHLLTTKTKHIKKLQSHSATNSNTATVRKRNQWLQRPFTELSEQEQGSASAHLVQCKGSGTTPDHNSSNIHSLFSLPSSGDCSSCLDHRSTPWANVTGEDFCYSSLVHTGQKIHLLGFALDLNTDCGWKARSSSSRALHWDHSSNIPPGTAFLWQSSNWTGNCIPSEPRGNSYSDF